MGDPAHLLARTPEVGVMADRDLRADVVTLNRWLVDHDAIPVVPVDVAETFAPGDLPPLVAALQRQVSDLIRAGR